jgi:arylsulfatase A-like enzyme
VSGRLKLFAVHTLWALAAHPQSLYRFDDQLKTAKISAAGGSQSTALAAPIVWRGFSKDTPWQLVRGRMGIRNAELIVKGEGSSPVILAPKEPSIDWSRYETLRVRMMAEGGTEIKVRIGDYEFQQKLAPPREYQVYSFDLNLTMPMYGRPLAIMPTESLTDLVSISSIELVPRRLRFPAPAGLLPVGKQEEYRNTLYAKSPSTISYDVRVPTSGLLVFGIGIVDKPVTFRVLAGGQNLYAKAVSNAEVWEDAEVDLSAFAGRTVRLTFRTESATQGAVALWANPVMTSAGGKPRPNVLLYLVDTLRAGHTSVHGYSRATTPFLSKLAAEGVVFEDCQAQATWTKPSVASMMTSLYSFTHGINMDTDTIPKGARTLAERLRGAGYVTASAVANPFAGRVTGLERGFDYLMEYPVMQRQRTDAADRGTDSAALNRVMLPWVERHRNEPFFLYVHSTDPHAPYRPPASVEKKYANPVETAAFDREYSALRELRQYGGSAAVGRADFGPKGIDPDQWTRRAIDRYDAEVEFNDHSIEALVGKLRELGLLDNTLVIVVSDHGEEFLDHGFTGHGHSLYEELTHSLWLMWNPKLVPKARRVKEPVQLIDVMPTLLDLLGIRAEGIVQGVSVTPLMKGQPLHRKQPVMSSRFRYANVRAKGFLPENRTGTFARIDGRWKLIYRDQAREAGLPEVELYDRRSDRAEAKNVAAANPEIVQRQLAEVRQWIEAQKQIRPHLGGVGKSVMDPAALERLRSLGYIGGTSGRGK